MIGAGYTGLAAAEALAAAGASVAVFERDTIGTGASGRNAGMVLAGLQADLRDVFARHGERVGRSCWEASLEGVALVERIHEEEGLAVERAGTLKLAVSPRHAEALQYEADWFERVLGYPARYLSRTEVRSEIGTDVFWGGLLEPIGLGIHPVRFLSALAERACRRGAQVLEHTPVSSIERIGADFVVRTPAGASRACNVLLATGRTTGGLVTKLRRHQLVVGSSIVVTEPLPPEVASRASPSRRLMYDTRHLVRYFRLLPDGRLLWGSRAALGPDAPWEREAHRLRRSMLRVFPWLEPYRVTHAWTGFVDLTRDRLPHLGETGGLHYALGLGGHGIALGVYLGRRAAARLVGGRSDCPFAELPLPRLPWGASSRWTLALVTGYYALVDRLTAAAP